MASPVAAASTTLSRPDAKATLPPGYQAPAKTITSVAPAPSEPLPASFQRPSTKATLAPTAPAAKAPAPQQAPVAPAAKTAPTEKPAIPAGAATTTAAVRPDAKATLPPGYKPKEQVASTFKPSETSGVTRTVRPDVNATFPLAPSSTKPVAKPVAAAAAAAATGVDKPAAPAAADASVRGERAAALPPSDAVKATITAAESVLISTARKNTRVIGAESGAAEPLDLERPIASRPSSPSIWSTSPRRASDDDLLRDDEMIPATPGVRAERIPVRAEPLLVRTDIIKRSDGTASTGERAHEPSGNAGLRSMPSVRFTLPPGALEEAAEKSGTPQKSS